MIQCFRNHSQPEPTTMGVAASHFFVSQRQQFVANSSRYLQTAASGLPGPVVQQVTQLAGRTW